jgi:MinD superfamily P-loop ATPase
MTEITVLSGKGGTGKTSLSAAFAALCSNVVVADCDVDAANLYLILQPTLISENKFLTGHKAVINKEICNNCGECIDYCRFTAISLKEGQVEISPTSCDGCMLCMRVCSYNAIKMVPSENSRWYTGVIDFGKMVYARLEPGEENSGKLVNLVRKKAQELAKETISKIIIIDGPPGIGCPVISSLTGAGKAIIVAEPTLSGFCDMKRIVELIENYRIKPYVIINKYDLNANISDQINDWCFQRGIIVAGKIPFDENIVKAMLHCKSIVEWMPKSETSVIIGTIWNKINSDE